MKIPLKWLADYASTDWARILRHYDELYRLKPSPIVALNRAVAVAHLEGPRAGLDAVAAIPQPKTRRRYQPNCQRKMSCSFSERSSLTNSTGGPPNLR